MFREIKHFNPITLNFLIATFLMGLSNGIFDAVYNFYLEARGVNKIAIGYIYSIAMVMMACTVIPLIYLSRRISQKKLLLIFSFIYAIPFLLLPILTSVWSCAVALGFILSGMIALLSLGNSLIGFNVKTEYRTTLFSYFFVSYLWAAMMGSVVTSLVTYYSPAIALVNYQGLLIISFIVSLLMIYFRAKSIQNISEPERNISGFTWDNNMEWKNFITLFIASLLLGASVTLIFRFINIVINLVYSINVSEIALIMGGDKIVSIIGALCAPLLVKRFPLKPTIIIMGILTALCLYLASYNIPLIIFILLYFIRLFLNYCLMPLLDTLAIIGFAKEKILLSTSIRQLAFYLGGALSATFYGKLLDEAKWEYTLIISSILAFIGTVFMSFIRIENK